MGPFSAPCKQAELDTNEGEFAAHVPIDFRSQKARVRVFPPRVASTPIGIPSSTFAFSTDISKKNRRYRFEIIALDGQLMIPDKQQ